MLTSEAKKALFAYIAGIRGQRREQGREEVKLMFVDVKTAHLNAKCDEENGKSCPKSSDNLGSVPG